MASVDKILIGSPAYKTLVGNVTRVHKVVVGVPLSTIVIGPYADIDNIVGVDTSGKTDGGTFVYDSDTGNFIVTNDTVLDVDGKTYPSDSAHSNILIRRSGTQGEPIILQQGEMAYSYLPDFSTDGLGNGGDRLYIATGDNDLDGNSTSIDIIGGKYFTDLLNHPQGTLTPNSAIITDADNKVNRLLADSAGFTIVRSTEAFFETITLTSSSIRSDSATLESLNGVPYLVWSSNSDNLIGYAGGEEAFKTKQVLGLSGLEVQNFLDVAGSLTTSGNLTVDGITNLDSATVDGDLLVTGNLTVQGQSTNISTTELLIEDKQIVIADGTPVNQPELASGAGIALGDSANPIGWIRYINNGVDSASWTFSDGIDVPFLKVPVIDFEVIDCGKYA